MVLSSLLAAAGPSSWLAQARTRLASATARRSAGSWTAALAGHLALVAAVVTFAPRPPPPEPVREALNVEVVYAPPSAEEPEPDASSEEAEEAAPAPAPEPPAPTGPPERFDVQLPDRPWPDVLRRRELAGPGAPDAGAAVGVPDNVRQALLALFYCRSTAVGIAAERARCPQLIDPAVITARVDAMDPRTFTDPVYRGARPGVDFAPKAPEEPLASGYDRRLSAAGEMRDRLPPSSPDPVFGD